MEPNMKNYDDEYRRFRWNVPEFFNFASDVVDKLAEDRKKLAMLWTDESGKEKRITFHEFKIQSIKLANGLVRLGCRRNDTVLVMLSAYPEWWEITLACLRIGAIFIPATQMLTPKDIEYRVELADVRFVITNRANMEKFIEIRKRFQGIKYILIDSDAEGWLNYRKLTEKESAEIKSIKTKSSEPALIYFTSGTTGMPKMVLHTHASYPFAHRVTGRYWLDLKENDLHWNLSDTGWAKAAWSSIFGPWNMGSAVFINLRSGTFDAKNALSLIEKYRITTFCAPPTAYRMMILEDLKKYDLSTLRHCVAAGEPLNPEVIRAWGEGTGVKIYDGYGQTESVNLLANFRCNPIKPGSMGKPVPGFHVEVVDDSGREVAPEVEGNIAVRVAPERPAGLFKEYWKNPDATRSTILGKWYITGDRAYKDGEGYFWFVGRADDVIKASGYRIGPFEIESVLMEHPAVMECAVVGSPDPVRGEIVKAFVILKKGYSPSDNLVREIQEHVKKNTAPYKYPRAVEFVKELPKTISGKIKRKELRQREFEKAGKSI